MEQTTQTQLVEIQQVVLRMSKYFVAFCEEHNLTCYFVEAVVLEQSAVKVLFHGMMT